MFLVVEGTGKLTSDVLHEEIYIYIYINTEGRTDGQTGNGERALAQVLNRTMILGNDFGLKCYIRIR